MNNSVVNAKRKYASLTTEASICGLCNKENQGGELNPSLGDCCDKCSERAKFITNLWYPEFTNNHSRVQEISIGLHGIEVTEAAMACIGEFLTPTERALFGAALDPNGLTGASEMTTGRNVDTLDFADIDPQLAARLTDDHLRCILVNINAKNHLKVLKLTHCVGMTGRGLLPMRESRVVELIDLSLADLHASPKNKSGRISEGVVLPILDSILHQGKHSALKHIQFYKKWTETRWFQDFMTRYNSFIYMEPRQFCLRCNNSTTKGFTCYLCLGYVCNECFESTTQIYLEYQHARGSSCKGCEKNFCHKCVEIRQCQGDSCVGLEPNYCVECTKVCKTCNIVLCSSCSTGGGTCEGCGNGFCGNFGTNCLGEHCIGCNKSYCDRCVEFDFCCCGEALCPDCRSDEDACTHVQTQHGIRN